MVNMDPLPNVKQEKIKLTEINEYLTCKLCKGYFIDATTISECLHSFCRSCIIRFLQDNSHCPTCEMIINKAKPNIKLDKTLQDIVYKLVPELFINEMARRQRFYRDHPEHVAKTTPEERGIDTERTIFNPKDAISLSIEYISDDSTPGAINVPDTKLQEKQDSSQQQESQMKRFLQCPGNCRIEVLKKFVQNKYSVDIASFHIEILYKRVPLPNHYTLIDIAYIYSWKRNEPMKFFFRILERSSVEKVEKVADPIFVKPPRVRENARRKTIRREVEADDVENAENNSSKVYTNITLNRSNNVEIITKVQKVSNKNGQPIGLNIIKKTVKKTVKAENATGDESNFEGPSNLLRNNELPDLRNLDVTISRSCNSANEIPPKTVNLSISKRTVKSGSEFAQSIDSFWVNRDGSSKDKENCSRNVSANLRNDDEIVVSQNRDFSPLRNAPSNNCKSATARNTIENDSTPNSSFSKHNQCFLKPLKSEDAKSCNENDDQNSPHNAKVSQKLPPNLSIITTTHKKKLIGGRTGANQIELAENGSENETRLQDSKTNKYRLELEPNSPRKRPKKTKTDSRRSKAIENRLDISEKTNNDRWDTKSSLKTYGSSTRDVENFLKIVNFGRNSGSKIPENNPEVVGNDNIVVSPRIGVKNSNLNQGGSIIIDNDQNGSKILDVYSKLVGDYSKFIESNSKLSGNKSKNAKSAENLVGNRSEISVDDLKGTVNKLQLPKTVGSNLKMLVNDPKSTKNKFKALGNYLNTCENSSKLDENNRPITKRTSHFDDDLKFVEAKLNENGSKAIGNISAIDENNQIVTKRIRNFSERDSFDDSSKTNENYNSKLLGISLEGTEDGRTNSKFDEYNSKNPLDVPKAIENRCGFKNESPKQSAGSRKFQNNVYDKSRVVETASEVIGTNNFCDTTQMNLNKNSSNEDDAKTGKTTGNFSFHQNSSELRGNNSNNLGVISEGIEGATKPNEYNPKAPQTNPEMNRNSSGISENCSLITIDNSNSSTELTGNFSKAIENDQKLSQNFSNSLGLIQNQMNENTLQNLNNDASKTVGATKTVEESHSKFGKHCNFSGNDLRNSSKIDEIGSEGRRRNLFETATLDNQEASENTSRSAKTISICPKINLRMNSKTPNGHDAEAFGNNSQNRKKLENYSDCPKIFEESPGTSSSDSLLVGNDSEIREGGTGIFENASKPIGSSSNVSENDRNVGGIQIRGNNLGILDNSSSNLGNNSKTDNDGSNLDDLENDGSELPNFQSPGDNVQTPGSNSRIPRNISQNLDSNESNIPRYDPSVQNPENNFQSFKENSSEIRRNNDSKSLRGRLSDFEYESESLGNDFNVLRNNLGIPRHDTNTANVTKTQQAPRNILQNSPMCSNLKNNSDVHGHNGLFNAESRSNDSRGNSPNHGNNSVVHRKNNGPGNNSNVPGTNSNVLGVVSTPQILGNNTQNPEMNGAFENNSQVDGNYDFKALVGRRNDFESSPQSLKNESNDPESNSNDLKNISIPQILGSNPKNSETNANDSQTNGFEGNNFHELKNTTSQILENNHQNSDTNKHNSKTYRNNGFEALGSRLKHLEDYLRPSNNSNVIGSAPTQNLGNDLQNSETNENNSFITPGSRSNDFGGNSQTAAISRNDTNIPRNSSSPQLPRNNSHHCKTSNIIEVNEGSKDLVNNSAPQIARNNPQTSEMNRTVLERRSDSFERNSSSPGNNATVHGSISKVHIRGNNTQISEISRILENNSKVHGNNSQDRIMIENYSRVDSSAIVDDSFKAAENVSAHRRITGDNSNEFGKYSNFEYDLGDNRSKTSPNLSKSENFISKADAANLEKVDHYNFEIEDAKEESNLGSYKSKKSPKTTRTETIKFNDVDDIFSDSGGSKSELRHGKVEFKDDDKKSEFLKSMELTATSAVNPQNPNPHSGQLFLKITQKRKNPSPVKNERAVPNKRVKRKTSPPQKIVTNPPTPIFENAKGTTANDELKQIFSNCKFNIPSSLSITLKETNGEDDHKNLKMEPVKNYIEILKLPDQDKFKSRSAPNLANPGNKSFQTTFEDSIAQNRCGQKRTLPGTNQSSKRPRFDFERFKNAPPNLIKFEQVSAKLHSPSLGMNFTVSVDQNVKTHYGKLDPKFECFKKKRVEKTPPPKIEKPAQQSKVERNGKTELVPKAHGNSPNHVQIGQHIIGIVKKSPTKNAERPQVVKKLQQMVPILPKPANFETNATMQSALTTNQIMEKYNIQNLAQLTASLNFNPMLNMQPSPMVLQQAILKQFELQNRQNWQLSQFQTNNKYLPATNINTNRIISKEN